MTNRARGFVILLLAAACLRSGEAGAQAHGPPATEFLDETESSDPAAGAARLSEMETFLRRLVGRFRDSRGKGNYSERLVDCVAIGAGPGVQCMDGLGSRSNTGGGTTAALFGLDPGAQKVNFLRVNAKGIAEGGLGKFSGNTLHIKFPCTIPKWPKGIISCETRLQYYTLAGSKEVSITTMYILRILTPKGVIEQISTGYTWLNRRSATGNSKGE